MVPVDALTRAMSSNRGVEQFLQVGPCRKVGCKNLAYMSKSTDVSVFVGQLPCAIEVGGDLALGQWQSGARRASSYQTSRSVLFIDLDGPRNRTVGVQVFG